MSVLLECPSCRRKFQVKEEHAGRRFHCPSCGRQLPVSQPRPSDHDVFISYSAADKAAAEAVCAALERRGFPCWIAPRDILPGADWGEAIIEAIEHGRLMVLMFSADANKSPQVKREVERAASKGVSIVPVRIEDVAFSKSMEYFISTQHWFDAFPPPLTRHLPGLTEAVEKLLASQTDRPRAPVTRDSPATPVRDRPNPISVVLAAMSRSLPLIVAGGSILIALVMMLLIVALWPRGNSDPRSVAPPAVRGRSANPILGSWKLTAESLRSLDSTLEKISNAGRLAETLDEARKKYREFRLNVEPTSQTNQVQLVMLARNEAPVRVTLSSSDDAKRFEGRAGRFIATLEIEPGGTLKAIRIPYGLLPDEFVYERAD
jgi:TIR domain